MKTKTYVWMLVLCVPLLVSCGNRSVSRSADRSNLAGSSIPEKVEGEQQLTSGDVAKAKTTRMSRSQSVAASSVKKTSSREKRKTAEVKPPVDKKLVAEAEKKPKETVSSIVLPDTTNTNAFFATTEPVSEMVDKPLSPVISKQETDVAPPVITILTVEEERMVEKTLTSAQLDSMNTLVAESRETKTPEMKTTTVTQLKKEIPTSPVSTSSKKEEKIAGCVLREASILNTYSVVVGSFVNPASAALLIKKLTMLEYKPFFVKNEKGMYRLIAGSFEDKDDADFQALKLDIESLESWVYIK